MSPHDCVLVCRVTQNGNIGDSMELTADEARAFAKVLMNEADRAEANIAA
jgi:hypothetical protein